jgi:hypothetical protein
MQSPVRVGMGLWRLLEEAPPSAALMSGCGAEQAWQRFGWRIVAAVLIA